MIGHRMAADYQTLFGGLAKEFGVTLVAASIATLSRALSCKAAIN